MLRGNAGREWLPSRRRWYSRLSPGNALGRTPGWSRGIPRSHSSSFNTPAARWPSGVTNAQIVDEFRVWAAALAREGRLLFAEELDTGRVLVDSSGARLDQAALGSGGLFVVRAPDADSAARAGGDPAHVRQGGVVAVQRLVMR